MRHAIIFLLFGIIYCQKKNPWNAETADERLDSARDLNHDGRVNTKEIRDYYESHPEKMSKEGIDFIDRNFNTGASVDLEGYRKLVKNWLTEKGSVEKILVGVYGNKTDHVPTRNVSKTKSISRL